MVHFWNRSSRSLVTPAMLQPREWPGRSGTAASQTSSNAVGVVRGGSRGGSKSGGGGGGGRGGGGDSGSSSGGGGGGGSGGSGGGSGGGLCLLSRLGQYKRRQHEQYKRRVAEKELDTLHHRIDKLLAKMEERDPDTALDDDEECVVCLGARATMQTFPCEHRVVCRKCFIRTIQVAVAQRSLPLRCVVCRTRILKLRHCSPGSKAVSVNAESPFQSSSAPRTKHKLSHNGNGFIVNNNNNNNNAAISNNNNNNTTIVNNNKIHAVTSLGKVSPCRPAGQGNRKGMKPSSSSLFAPEPPRVTLTKAAPSHFSPLAKSSHPNQRDASPSVTLTSTTAKMTTTATTTTTTSIRAAPATKQATPGKKGDVIVDTTLAVSKGNNSHSSRRGRVFPFRSLFSRQ